MRHERTKGKEMTSLEKAIENCEYLLNIEKWKYATIDMEVVENADNLVEEFEAKGYKTRTIETLHGRVLVVEKTSE